jgi:hypothetical protein
MVQPGLPKAGLKKESMMKKNIRYPDNITIKDNY